MLTLKCSAILSDFFLKSETFVIREKLDKINNNSGDNFGGKIMGLFEFEKNFYRNDRSLKFVNTNTAITGSTNITSILLIVAVQYLNI